MLTFLLSVCGDEARERVVYLYKTYHDKMVRLAKRRLQLSGWHNYVYDAEDVVQEAFVKLVKYAHRIDFSVEPPVLEAYVLTTVANAASSFLSAEGKGSVQYIEDVTEPIYDADADAVFEQIEREEQYGKVVGEILLMDEIYSAPLLLRYGMELSVQEIADILSVPEKTVYTRLGRGIDKIKRIIGAEDRCDEKKK
jgi:RNA polymerase sigma-70 factor (ECF subfamily)